MREFLISPGAQSILKDLTTNQAITSARVEARKRNTEIDEELIAKTIKTQQQAISPLRLNIDKSHTLARLDNFQRLAIEKQINDRPLVTLKGDNPSY